MQIQSVKHLLQPNICHWWCHCIGMMLMYYYSELFAPVEALCQNKNFITNLKFALNIVSFKTSENTDFHSRVHSQLRLAVWCQNYLCTLTR